ncbi:MAG: type I DNA topoisomerase [Saprospiraceae bacterium]|nr:type I DNA topoisomerase [Saprospiraceae bacterium]
MAKNLLIVESPAKAKTIEKILGKDFKVKSSYGHVRDLEKKPGAVDVDNGFTPKYIVSPEKAKVVKELRQSAKAATDVWLATDEDREGEAISWHLCEVLGLDPMQTKRIVFREITPPAIKKAVQSPRTVDINLVNAQQARRILDRLVGFELSEILWRKVKGKLSAGRVQSVAVKLIVDREREINEFEITPFFKVSAVFEVAAADGSLTAMEAELKRQIPSFKEANEFLEKLKDADFKITKVEVKPSKRNPPAPFTTSTLQQEASRRFGFAVKRTMMIAQKLYEAGHITYMRTDSTALSEVALQNIADVVKKNYGDHYHKARRFKGKKELAQEAHEAIRPTYFENTSVSTDHDEQRLYDLIWKRTVAGQMAEAQLERTIVTIQPSTIQADHFTATGEVLKFDGFLKLYLESKEEEDDDATKGILPPVKEGQSLHCREVTAKERFSRPPARYTEARLVKKLEELGIGRPSTYAPTISKIMEPGRGYIVKERREGHERAYRVVKLKDKEIQSETLTEITGASSNRLFPSDVGMVVTDFLSDHFEEVMNYGFTAEIEKKFDHIASGKANWQEMLSAFYHPFHKDVEDTLQNAERSAGERLLGIDEETGHSIVARISRFGTPMIQIGKRDEVAEDEKPRFANLKPTQSIASITLEEAMELFKLPIDMGTYEGQPVVINQGRFGPYVKFGESFISLDRGEDPFDVDRERAIELIERKKKEDAPVGTYKELPITRGKGRFGPFLKWNGMFVNIPKRYNPDELPFDTMIELIKVKEEKEANRYIHHWPEDKLSVENGRWGPYIKYKKKNFKIPKKEDGTRVTSEEAKEYTREYIEQLIEEQAPGTIKKKKAPKKKATKKK